MPINHLLKRLFKKKDPDFNGILVDTCVWVMKKLWGISWLYVLQMASASCSFKDLFHSLFFFICWCTCGNSFPFYLRLWPLAAPRAHPRADRRAWLQLPHMTSPFASWHSLHLPSPGPTKDKVCLKSVCAYVKVCEYYQAKCHSFISYIQYCVVDFLSSQEKHKHKCRHICTQTPTLVCIDMAQNERTSTLFNLAELCFFLVAHTIWLYGHDWPIHVHTPVYTQNTLTHTQT